MLISTPYFLGYFKTEMCLHLSFTKNASSVHNWLKYLHMCPMPDISHPDHVTENGRPARNTPLENTALLQMRNRCLWTLQHTPWKTHKSQPGSPKSVGPNIYMPVFSRNPPWDAGLHGHRLIQTSLQQVPNKARWLYLSSQRRWF